MNTTVEYKTLLEEMKSLHEAIDEIKSLLIGTHNVETKNENEAENNERASCSNVCCRIPCSVCGKKFANKYICATHMKTVHNPDRITYTCNKCNDFWVKNHCREDIHHPLIKHVDNYHSINKDKNDPWYVICPVCFNGMSGK